MNKAIAVAIVCLAVAVALQSGAVFYLSKCVCPRPCEMRGGGGGEMQRPMPCPMNQQGPRWDNGPVMSGPERQQQRMSPPGNSDRMGGPGQEGQSQRGPGMGMQGGQGQQQPNPTMNAGQGQQQTRSPGQDTSTSQNRSGSPDQISTIMQEASQEAQNFFRSQNRRPERQEMQAKVKELVTQKMTAQGISQDVQQTVLSDIDKKSPPQQSQQPQQRP